MNSNRTPILVSGPTAGGKSDLAIRLAQSLNGEVINLDSVQIYRGADTGSAKPSPEMRAAVPHHLFDICDPDQGFDVAKFTGMARGVIDEVQSRGRQPVLTGGTTLYITHLLHGLAELPAADQGIRSSLERLESPALYEKLKACDPQTAERLHPNDRLRIIRALEAFMITGVPVSSLRAGHAYAEDHYRALILVLCRNREVLYERINRRSEVMIKAGLVNETAGLIEKYGRDINLLGTLGYKQAGEFLSGTLPEQELAPAIAMYTRRFAKRQMTYWRNEPAKRGWAVRPGEGDDFIEIDSGSAGTKRGGRVKQMAVLNLSEEALRGKIEQRLKAGFDRSEVWFLDAAALFGH